MDLLQAGFAVVLASPLASAFCLHAADKSAAVSPQGLGRINTLEI